VDSGVRHQGGEWGVLYWNTGTTFLCGLFESEEEATRYAEEEDDKDVSGEYFVALVPELAADEDLLFLLERWGEVMLSHQWKSNYPPRSTTSPL
jgi:hypothetical protein